MTGKSKIFALAMVACLGAGPAFALGDQNNNQQAHGGAGGAGGAGGNGYGGQGGSAGAIAGASAGASSGSVSGAFSGGNSLHQGQGQGQSLFNSNGASSDQGQSTAVDGDKTDVTAVSYTDSSLNTVAATVTDCVAVTTWGIGIAGPVFKMTDQHVHSLPCNVSQKAALVYSASVNDGTDQSVAEMHAVRVALCADDEYKKLMEVRFGEDGCDLSKNW